MGKIEDNRTQTLAIIILSILEANLKTTMAKNSEMFGQIADNRAQTLAFTIRSIPEANN